MEQIDVRMQLDNVLGASACHVWILDSNDDWVLIYGSSLSEDEKMLYSNASWLESSYKKSKTFINYDFHIGWQLFQFETEGPDSIPVRASIKSNRQLSQLECDHFVLQIRYLLLRQNWNRHWLEHDAWLQGLHSLTSLLDLNELLQNIMKNASIAIPAFDRGFLTLYDPEIQKLIPKASIGMGPTIYDYKTNIGEGITGKVFQAGVGQIYNINEAMEALSDLQAENVHFLQNAVNDSDIKGTGIYMAVPIRMNKEKLGVIIVHQIKKKRELSKEDLRRLQGFADQAAIAITNARLFSELRETNEYLVKRNHIHEVFTKLSLKDSDLIIVAKTVEQMINLPVSLFDMTKNEWYPHYTPLSRRLMDTDLLNGWENRVETLTVTINETSFHLYPIVNEGLTIGYFVVELLRPLKPLDTVVLEQGSALVALKMVNTYSMTDLHYKRSYEFFNELLQFKEPNLLVAKSKDFGLSPDRPLFVTVLQLTKKAQDVKKREAHLRRLIASLHGELGHSDILLFGFDDKVTILLHAANKAKQESLIQKLEVAVIRWQKYSSPPLYCGIGRLYAELENVVKSTEEANKSLSYLFNQDKPGILRYENIGINRLFLNQETKDIEQFIQEVLSPLQSPKAQASELELTLKTYIAAKRSTSMTAERLHIHPNTLYHRIKKIEDLLAVDLNEPNDWLTLLLACHLSETY
ncbi:helix-turn-helix domain-containing protein [Bacillus sp. 1P10SD]|uniref:helix-turn-helix domain-containing protein n=1 Tax=Bacillus sp. 1P10SD TaxID=3132265 RepID=UPI0039A5C449